MIETAADLVWHMMVIVSGMALVLGAGLCAVHLSDRDREPPT